MKTFGWTERYVKWGMTGQKLWCYYNWAMANEASLFGGGMAMTTDGYVAQEIEMISERKKNR